MNRNHFTKLDLYEFARSVGARCWQDAWMQYMGACTVLTISEDYVNVIVIQGGGDIYLKKGDVFVRLDFEGVRGEGEYVGKTLIPTSVKVTEVTEGGLVGSVHKRKREVIRRGYTRVLEREVWESRRGRFEVSIELQLMNVYGAKWKQFFQWYRDREEERRKNILLNKGLDWAKREGVDIRCEEVLILIGESILEEEEEKEKRIWEERKRHIWGGYQDEDSEEEDLVIFYVGPDVIVPKFRRGTFLRAWLNFLFHKDPLVLIDYML